MMKTKTFTPALLVIAALIGACSSMPKTTSLLEETRSDYRAAQSNPKTETYAPLQMKQAGEALDLANVAASKNESVDTIDKLAYIAKQKIAVTQEVIKQKSAEAEVASAGKERDQIRLEQRTNEADQAKASAARSKLSADVANANADAAERESQAARAHAAILEGQLADLAAKKTERGMVITLGDVLFGTDQAQLNAGGMQTAQKLAKVLQENPQRNVLIEGFTDSTGSAAHNQELSERRATSVRNTLEGLGVARDRVGVRGYGETYPVAANDTAPNRQLNRRVEIVLSDASGKIGTR